MLRHRAFAAGLAVLIAPYAALGEGEATFQGTGFLVPTCPSGPISNDSWGHDVSQDGRVVVGSARGGNPPGTGCGGNTTATGWTAEGGMFDLDPAFNPANHDRSDSVSADGTAAVGIRKPTASVHDRFLWTESGGIQILPVLPGGVPGTPPTDNPGPGFPGYISGDGTVVLGQAPGAAGQEAFRWTQAAGIEGLGFLDPAFPDSTARSMSADHQVIVGRSAVDVIEPLPGLFFFIQEAFRWTAADGMVGLGTLGVFNVTASSEAKDVSADGSVIVGRTTVAGLGLLAFRWTQAGGMVALGDLPTGSTSSDAFGVSGNGALVVGTSNVAQPAGGWIGNEGYLWDAAHGMRSLYEVLLTNYAHHLGAWDLKIAANISDDGRFVTGSGSNHEVRGFNSEGFVAFLPDPYMIVIDNFERAGFTLVSGGLGDVVEGSQQTLLPEIFGSTRTLTLESADAAATTASLTPTLSRDALAWTVPPTGASLDLSWISPSAMDFTNAGQQDRLVFELGEASAATSAVVSVGDDLGGSSTSGALPLAAGRVDVPYAVLAGDVDWTRVTTVSLELDAASAGSVAIGMFRTGRLTACANGLDDDGDGQTDYPADAGCRDAGAEREAPHCDNGIDDDGDGQTDYPADSECSAAWDLAEAVYACSDGIDNDGNGSVDFPADIGCGSPYDPVEETITWHCSDGIDQDSDGTLDFPEDPGCFAGWDDDEKNTGLPCDDSLDNDGDGQTDIFDAGCTSPHDLAETEPGVPCDDGLDDDGDGRIDFSPITFLDPSAGDGDPGCRNSAWFSESPECDDDIDNDADLRVDWDGGPAPTVPDPQCVDAPWAKREVLVGGGCGLGAEWLPWVAAWAAARRLRATRRGSAT